MGSLTPRQRQVIRLAAAGYSNKQIAKELGIKLSTVKGLLGFAYDALGATNRAHAVALWLEQQRDHIS